MDFSELGLSPEIAQAVTEAGYVTPTPIQEQAIPVVLMGRDVLGCAQTGTGKTAGFTLPMIDILSSGRARARMPRSLILEPTRELATQVAVSFEKYGKNNSLNMALLIGGESFADQQRKLDRGVDVLIATPGRLLDLFERGKILLSDVKVLVIDEADRMLDMGFIPDVERIVGFLPRIRQTLFFSATMPPEIRGLAEKFLMNPKEITVAPPASPATTVVQGLVTVEPEGKRDALRLLLQSQDVRNAIIFCNRKRDVDTLSRSLQKHGLDAAALHGDMPQPKRTETLERFKAGDVRLLVASDVAARGLDVQGLSHVFNFDVPIHPEDYVHRIGRTGRAGLEGHAFTLAAPEDGRFVTAIEKLIGKEIPRMTIDGIDPAELEFEEGKRRRGRGKAVKKSDQPRPEDRKRREAPAAEAEAAKAKPKRREAPAAEATPGETKPRRRRDERKAPPHAEPRRRAASGEVVRMSPEGMEGNVARLQTAEHARKQAHEDQDDKRVVGFGDHLPAFLARPVRVAGGRR
jgi:superfamily II DNA/RNA helicase